jgi:hypothetical protein
LPYLGKKVVVPDHKIYFAAFDDEDEAYFVAGFLTSQPVKTFIDSFTVKLQVGAVLDKVCVPEFDRKDPHHAALSDAAKRGAASQKQIDDLAINIIRAMPLTSRRKQDELLMVAEPSAPRVRRRSKSN